MSQHVFVIAQNQPKPNVLFITFDDLCPELSIEGPDVPYHVYKDEKLVNEAILWMRKQI